MEYIRRDVIDVALSKLRHDHVLVLTGARQTGKTTFCEKILPNYLNLPFTYISFDDPDERLRFQQSAIAILEAIETPLVILDEVQKIPPLFDPLKYVIDKQEKKGGEGKKTFVLTGSSQLLLMRNISESLAGRIALLHLYPFSFKEVTRMEGVPLLSKIWTEGRLDKKEAERINAASPEIVRRLRHLREDHQKWGGYPPVWQRKEAADKIAWLKDYRKTYIERDISDVGQVGNIETFVLTQKLLCSRTAQILSISEVARDVSLSVNTVKRYINLLSMTFQGRLLQPYYENIGKRFIKSPKIYFPDVGLNRVILGEMSVDAGASYETWVFSEIIKWKQLQSMEPDLYFYRTSAGMEIDFLIAGEGKIVPVEVKSSDRVNYTDGRNLESFMNEHKNSPLGLIIYHGKEVLKVRKNIWALPDWVIFGII
ncbi:MAG: ATP-binding protein [Nitrospirae bacterium]|nr:ATP-binding protein [Nitrospirota bacterium]MCL5422103.1 ATP-binding protein [Nitrospirota bacterium]